MKKLFTTLIIIVACVVVGAFVLNSILPNTMNTLVDTAEDTVHQATGLALDFNGDGRKGGGAPTNVVGTGNTVGSTGVSGFTTP